MQTEADIVSSLRKCQVCVTSKSIEEFGWNGKASFRAQPPSLSILIRAEA